MMKLLAYLFFFLVILGVAGFGFFTITTPNIPQTQISKEIDPKQAFETPTTLGPAPSVTPPSTPVATPVPPANTEE